MSKRQELDRDYQFRRDYGITVLDYEQIFERQGGKCAICGTLGSLSAFGNRKRLHVDHDHETREVRGLLCLACNSGLGMLKDSRLILQQALTYLDTACRIPFDDTLLKRTLKTHCSKGHEYTEENTQLIGPKKSRRCRTCQRTRLADYRIQAAKELGRPIGLRNKDKTHCKNGHEFAGDNVLIIRGGRYCRTCKREYMKTYQHKQPKKPTCAHGHRWTAENTYINPNDGQRSCRTCSREYARLRFGYLTKRKPDIDIDGPVLVC